MVEIKDLYEKTYKTALADDIKKHYTNDVKSLLLALIKGTYIAFIVLNNEKCNYLLPNLFNFYLFNVFTTTSAFAVNIPIVIK